MDIKFNIDMGETLENLQLAIDKVKKLKKEVQELNALIENKIPLDDYATKLHTGEVILPNKKSNELVEVKWDKYCNEIVIELSDLLIGKREDEVDEFMKRFNERLRDILDK